MEFNSVSFGRRKAVQARYNHSAKGRARSAKYYSSDKYRAKQARYRHSEIGLDTDKVWKRRLRAGIHTNLRSYTRVELMELDNRFF